MSQLKQLFATRRSAALTAYLGALVLLPALFLPAVTITRFGVPSPYSILAGVADLTAAGGGTRARLSLYG